MKTNPVTAESYHGDGMTERHDVANNHFRILRNHQNETQINDRQTVSGEKKILSTSITRDTTDGTKKQHTVPSSNHRPWK